MAALPLVDSCLDPDAVSGTSHGGRKEIVDEAAGRRRDSRRPDSNLRNDPRRSGALPDATADSAWPASRHFSGRVHLAGGATGRCRRVGNPRQYENGGGGGGGV